LDFCTAFSGEFFMKFLCAKAFVFAVLVVVFLSDVNGLAPVDIKSTHFIMSPQFKKWSPVEGAIGWESSLIKKFYELGEPNDATVQLIKDLFHSPGGSFGVSTNKSTLAAHLSVGCLGKIVGLIVRVGETDEFEAELTDLILQDPDFDSSAGAAA
jgi:hypothetical protein